jgi:hypothetical protein
MGAIVAIEPAARRLTIKSDAGPEIGISLEEATRYLRVSPGAKDLEDAAAISVSDLAVGDRILARGQSAGVSFVANMIIVISKADLARKHAAERAEWQKRGVGGVITALNPVSGEITVKPPAVTGAGPMVIALAPGSVLRRYAPNTVKFSDARPCAFEDLRVGDQVKALGTSNEDRSRFTAEEVVAGSFRNIVATVAGSERERSIVLLTDLATNKRLQAQVTQDSAVHRLSATVVQMLAARTGGATAAPAREASPAQRPGDLQTAIETLPPLNLADLKPGEAVIVTCTKNDGDPSRVTAITLLAGIEPLLKASSRSGRALDLGSWNLDLSMSAGMR